MWFCRSGALEIDEWWTLIREKPTPFATHIFDLLGTISPFSHTRTGTSVFDSCEGELIALPQLPNLAPNSVDTDTTGGLDYSEFVTTAVVFGMFSKKDMVKCTFSSITLLCAYCGKKLILVQFASRYLILTKVDTWTRFVFVFILAARPQLTSGLFFAQSTKCMAISQPLKEELKNLVRMLHVAGVVVNIKKALYQYDKDQVALLRMACA